MKVTATASTGAKILVWREEGMFAARRTGPADEPQLCRGVDLFEVIAELAGLDLDDPTQGEEALQLAAHAQQRLSSSSA